jgi:integrase
MNPTLSDALTRTPRALRSILVFPTPRGEVYKNTHHIEAALVRCAERAGIEGGVTFQQLRHTFCSHVQMQDVPPIEVQKWMGHKDLRTTLRYSHTSASHEKASMARFSYESPATKLRDLG